MKVEFSKIPIGTIASEEKFQLATYKKMPIVADRGEGVWLYASDGDKYLDLYGGHAVAGTGHSHPVVTAAIVEQMGKTALLLQSCLFRRTSARGRETGLDCSEVTYKGLLLQLWN